MDCYKYKQFHSLSADKVLRQIKAHEQMGWSLYLLQPIHFLYLPLVERGGCKLSCGVKQPQCLKQKNESQMATASENIALTALRKLTQNGQYPPDMLPVAILTLGLDPAKMNSIVL